MKFTLKVWRGNDCAVHPNLSDEVAMEVGMDSLEENAVTRIEIIKEA